MPRKQENPSISSPSSLLRQIITAFDVLPIITDVISYHNISAYECKVPLPSCRSIYLSKFAFFFLQKRNFPPTNFNYEWNKILSNLPLSIYYLINLNMSKSIKTLITWHTNFETKRLPFPKSCVHGGQSIPKPRWRLTVHSKYTCNTSIQETVNRSKIKACSFLKTKQKYRLVERAYLVVQNDTRGQTYVNEQIEISQQKLFVDDHLASSSSTSLGSQASEPNSPTTTKTKISHSARDPQPSLHKQPAASSTMRKLMIKQYPNHENKRIRLRDEKSNSRRQTMRSGDGSRLCERQWNGGDLGIGEELGFQLVAGEDHSGELERERKRKRIRVREVGEETRSTVKLVHPQLCRSYWFYFFFI